MSEGINALVERLRDMETESIAAAAWGNSTLYHRASAAMLREAIRRPHHKLIRC
jgi:hypothetical protein